MTGSTAEQMMSLGKQLVAETAGTESDLTVFPSSSVMLDVRCGGRAFVMAYSPPENFGVDELEPGDAFVAGYRHAFRDFESAAVRLRDLIRSDQGVDSAATALNLVVIATQDLEAARDFYRLIGLSFVAEQHGNGPRHYAATSGTTVFELYPGSDKRAANPLRIGFQVRAVDRTVETLQRAGAKIVSLPKDSPWGRRAVVEDPEGNRVELAQPRNGNRT